MLQNCYFCTSGIKYMSELNTNRTRTKYSKGFIWLFREFITKETFTSKETQALEDQVQPGTLLQPPVPRIIVGAVISTMPEPSLRWMFITLSGYSCTTIHIYVVIGIVIIIDACRFVTFSAKYALDTVLPVHSSEPTLTPIFLNSSGWIALATVTITFIQPRVRACATKFTFSKIATLRPFFERSVSYDGCASCTN